MDYSEYVTITQLVEMKNVHRVTINRLLNEGFFEGAIQEIIDGRSTWLIPIEVATRWIPRRKGQHKANDEQSS